MNSTTVKAEAAAIIIVVITVTMAIKFNFTYLIKTISVYLNLIREILNFYLVDFRPFPK